MGRRPEQKCFQRRTDGQQATERCPICLLIRERQIKTTIFYLPSVRMAIIKKPTNSKKVGGDVEKRNPCVLLMRM